MSKRVTNYQLMQKLEVQQEKIDDIHECVFGDGNPEKGLVTRVLFIEKFVENANKIVWAAVLAIVVGVVNIAISLLS